jgi:hypothetical protein
MPIHTNAIAMTVNTVILASVATLVRKANRTSIPLLLGLMLDNTQRK